MRACLCGRFNELSTLHSHGHRHNTLSPQCCLEGRGGGGLPPRPAADAVRGAAAEVAAAAVAVAAVQRGAAPHHRPLRPGLWLPVLPKPLVAQAPFAPMLMSFALTRLPQLFSLPTPSGGPDLSGADVGELTVATRWHGSRVLAAASDHHRPCLPEGLPGGSPRPRDL